MQVFNEVEAPAAVDTTEIGEGIFISFAPPYGVYLKLAGVCTVYLPSHSVEKLQHALHAMGFTLENEELS